tara:strand:- start:163 stop:429 length:267 start_codon:yes stop_codon:yes gene_type:complete
MSEEPVKKTDVPSVPKEIKKFRKGDLVRVERGKYLNSLESKASDNDFPEYIFEGPGELLLIQGDYCQVRWRRPVPDVWFRTDQLIQYK